VGSPTCNQIETEVEFLNEERLFDAYEKGCIEFKGGEQGGDGQ